MGLVKNLCFESNGKHPSLARNVQNILTVVRGAENKKYGI